MTKKLIILNGPPQCGKDTLAEHIFVEFGACHVKFADGLKRMTHRLYNAPYGEDIAQFEHCKDEPSPLFYGLTPRQAYIAVSEQYVKPVHGMDFFGKRLLEKIDLINKEIFIASDGGLIEELIPVAEKLGGENILVVKIYRPMCDFNGDSRGYYPDSVLRKLSISRTVLGNTGTVEGFLRQGGNKISLWLEVNGGANQ
jgi:hypothetical protein